PRRRTVPAPPRSTPRPSPPRGSGGGASPNHASRTCTACSSPPSYESARTARSPPPPPTSPNAPQRRQVDLDPTERRRLHPHHPAGDPGQEGIHYGRAGAGRRDGMVAFQADDEGEDVSGSSPETTRRRHPLGVAVIRGDVRSQRRMAGPAVARPGAVLVVDDLAGGQFGH